MPSYTRGRCKLHCPVLTRRSSRVLARQGVARSARPNAPRGRRSLGCADRGAREYALLEYLVLHANEVISRAEIAEHVWDAPYEAMSNVIDVCIQRLRRKIDEPGRPSLIVTRRGEGYMLAAGEDGPAERP